MHEFEWIETYLRPLTGGRKEALALRDDAAIISCAPGQELVVTTDTINEAIHFLRDTPADAIAHKALATNLSDLAAKGATPYAYSLALSLTEAEHEAWLAAFCDSLAALQQDYGCFLLGGDMTRSRGGLSIAITALGWVAPDTALRRSGAQPGDMVYVSGTIGDALCGLHQLQHHPNTDPTGWLTTRYQRPTPRCALGRALIGTATACLDISDGLLQDGGHIAACSQVALELDATRIPISDPARAYCRQHHLPLGELLAGGDDYELLFTVPAEQHKVLPAIAAETGLALTAIGHVGEGAGIRLVDAHGQPIAYDKSGWQHF